MLEPESRLALHPRNPGNTLRGAFGSTFKRLVCPTPHECGGTCLMKTTCPYGRLFEPSPPPETDRLSLNRDIPRPFVFRPPSRSELTADSGAEALSFELNLIGSAADYLPYFLVTFRELGQQGIGIGRGRYTISRVLQLVEPSSANRLPFSVTREHESDSVTQKDNGQLRTDDGSRATECGSHATDNGQRITENGCLEIYSSQDQLVRPVRHRVTFEDCRRLVSQRMTGNGSRITVKFLTPTYLKVDGKIIERPDFHHLIKRLRDRINALAHFYCGETLDVEFKAFGERAESVRTIHGHVRWEDRDRRSWKTGLSHDMGGFVGEVTYEGKLEDFLPLLILGQYTHVGKYAVWGNGRYEIAE